MENPKPGVLISTICTGFLRPDKMLRTQGDFGTEFLDFRNLAQFGFGGLKEEISVKILRVRDDCSTQSGALMYTLTLSCTKMKVRKLTRTTQIGTIQFSTMVFPFLMMKCHLLLATLEALPCSYSGNFA
jgi:hypothetical protein